MVRKPKKRWSENRRLLLSALLQTCRPARAEREVARAFAFFSLAFPAGCFIVHYLIFLTKKKLSQSSNNKQRASNGKRENPGTAGPRGARAAATCMHTSPARRRRRPAMLQAAPAAHPSPATFTSIRGKNRAAAGPGPAAPRAHRGLPAPPRASRGARRARAAPRHARRAPRAPQRATDIARAQAPGETARRARKLAPPHPPPARGGRPHPAGPRLPTPLRPHAPRAHPRAPPPPPPRRIPC